MIIHKLEDRFKLTEQFLRKNINAEKSKILDVGSINNMSRYLISKGFNIQNTDGEIDFDSVTDEFEQYKRADVTTAFEVIEHLFDPMNFLSKLPTSQLVLTVPLQLWFAKPYMHIPVKDGGHVAYGYFHEFVEEQLHMLLDKVGWKIIAQEKWKAAPIVPLGIRPVLRWFVYSYIAVYCERTEPYQTGNYKITKPV